MAFIGTREKYRCEGMCRQLVDTIRSILLSLKVEKLVLPSTPEHVDYWTTHFGFVHSNEIQRQEMLSKNLMMFKDTVLLEKTLFLHDGFNEEQNGAGEDGPRGEDQPLEALLFDLNLESEEEVTMDNVHHNNVQNNKEEMQPLGIFLTLEPDGSLQLTKIFTGRSECLRHISF
ncbi:uncharacterized protein LOC122653208 [Telopea speciosissima]|uniref:uncharacterized protein LOC122653208 n=1 Tax=Telopea speciosissima TaxID=54955 RepID=UPI001CC6FB7F|nr:uncharacterized protein LOC122653208 [Telopea speciosissima]